MSGITFDSGGFAIDGYLHEVAEPAGTIAVAHPHPAHGGNMDHPVVVAICECAVAAGLLALRFDFRGVRRSEGDVEDLAGHLEDVRAASAEVEARVPAGARLGAGYSYGARLFARAVVPGTERRARLGGLLLLAPATKVPRTRRDFGRLLLGRPLDRAPNDPEAIEALGRIPFRTRVLVGDRDVVAPVDDLSDALAPASALTVLPGLNHFFSRGIGASETARDVLLPAIDRALAALL